MRDDRLLDRLARASYSVAVPALIRISSAFARRFFRSSDGLDRRRTDAHPLGPLVVRVAASHPVWSRLKAGAVLIVCLAVLGTAARLEPDRSGFGTHRQLGFATCTALMLTGYPCPTCGMTTAFTLTVRGEWAAAFHAQPAGFALALAVALAAAVASVTIATGSVWAVNWYRVSPMWTAIALVGMVLGGWAYKAAAGWPTGTFPFGRP